MITFYVFYIFLIFITKNALFFFIVCFYEWWRYSVTYNGCCRCRYKCRTMNYFHTYIHSYSCKKTQVSTTCIFVIAYPNSNGSRFILFIIDAIVLVARHREYNIWRQFINIDRNNISTIKTWRKC